MKPSLSRQVRRLAVTAGFGVAFFTTVDVAVAQAPPPPNDSRSAAQPLPGARAEVDGTTVGATAEESDPPSGCGVTTGNVWFALDDAPARRIVVRAQAHGDLDAIVSVYRRVRSRLVNVGCAATDERGRAALAFNAAADARYLLAVGQVEDSTAGAFSLSLSLAAPPARPPGARLPRRGVTSALNSLSDTEASWSFTMRQGVTYRINLATFGACLGITLYPPGTRSFERGTPVKHRGCGGYFTHTPGPAGGGRYSALLRSYGGEPQHQRYRLQVARAARDDMGPGLSLRNTETRRGALDGRRVDVIDMYHLDVGDRSEVTLHLATGASRSFDLLLLGPGGRRIACGCGSSGNVQVRDGPLAAGRYYAVVRAREGTAGAYRLSLVVRALTTTAATISGSRRQTAPLGRAVTLEATITPPPGGGMVRFRVERFDPLDGWHFHRQLIGRVSGSRAVVAWRPPTEGGWRVRARFLGTRLASASTSGNATLQVGP